MYKGKIIGSKVWIKGQPYFCYNEEGWKIIEEKYNQQRGNKGNERDKKFPLYSS